MSPPVRSSLFPDADLVDYVSQVYGPVMGCKCEDIFADDPDGESNFANSIRRTLTREYDALIHTGLFNDVMRDA
jgi:hypothetical protein